MIDYTKIFLFEVQLIFKSLKEYQDFFENHLSQKKLEFESSFEYSLNNEFQLRENFDEEYSESYLAISETYAHNFRALFLVQSYSLFEYELKKICEFYKEYNKSVRLISDIGGTSDFLKIKEFLKEDCGIPFKELEAELTFLNTIRKIRNRIIHHQSKVSCKDKKDWLDIKNFIKKNNKDIKFKEDIDKKFKNGKSVYENDYQFSFCILDRKFNDKFLETSECLINKILIDKLKFQQNEKLRNRSYINLIFKKMKNWKIILTLWIALGIATTGYFFIKPPLKSEKELNRQEKILRKDYNFVIGNENYYKFSILGTLIGSILIFGFGKYYKK